MVVERKGRSRAVEDNGRPLWATDFLRRATKPLPAEVIERRRRAAERILANRIDIRPDRVEDYIRAIREDEDDG